MTFSEALGYLKAGRQINKQGDIQELDSNFGTPYPIIWEPTQADLLAEDWEVRETS